MAEPFDPDAYLRSKAAPAAPASPGGFDPDAYLQAKAQTPAETSLGDKVATFGAHAANQGLMGFGEEILAGAKAHVADYQRALSGDVAGALRGQWEGLKDMVGLGRDPTLADVVQGKDGASEWTQRFRQNRDEVRGDLAAMEERNPTAALAGNITGAVGSGLLIPGGAAVRGATTVGRVARGALAGAAFGGAAGAGNSEADLTRGDVAGVAKDTAIGAGLGALGGAAGAAIGEGIAAGRRALAPVAARKLSEAKARAEAMAAEQIAKRNNTLRGIAGGEAQKASRLTENIRRIEGWDAVPDDPGALENAARAAFEKADKLRQQARAMGLDEAVDGAGALHSVGSKMDAANKARGLIDAYEQAGRELVDRAGAIRGSGGLRSLPPNAAERGMVVADDVRGNLLDVKRMRAEAMRSPEFMAQENQVLLHALEDLPDQRATAEAARAAYGQALRNTPGDVANTTDDLLSGRAAWDAVKARLLRYGPPLASSVAGAAFGGPVGAGMGAVAGLAAGRGLEALAGAGMRPALRSFINLVTKYPAVQNAVWGTAMRLSKQNPQALGKFAPMLTTASKEGTAMARVLHEALLIESPEYAAILAAEAAPEIDETLGGELATR